MSKTISLNPVGRRQLLNGGAALALAPALSTLGGCGSIGIGSSGGGGAGAGFKPVPISNADKPGLPAGYSATPLAAWGEPVGLAAAMPAFKPDASNTAAEQAAQFGMHHAGLQYLPLDGSRKGLLLMNHGGADEGLLHLRGASAWSADKVKKSQAAHGVSVAEIELKNDSWQVVKPSRLARRITAATPVTLAGPAAGHALLKTMADASGRRALGVLASGAVNLTPWGTCLVGEEAFADCFSAADTPLAHERRYGLRRLSANSGKRWHEFDDRFDTVRHPQEANRYGWVTEFDPADPQALPVKRTALGRGAHAGAWATISNDGRAVVYSAEAARFEYLYKFVSRDKVKPAGGGRSAAQANAELLNSGTLYVARFSADGSGVWLPLVHDQGPLNAAGGFNDAAELLVKTRQAADAVGATRMDRPEALAIDSASGWVYAALAHNALRGTAGQPGPDAANPRPANAMGHILRWKEAAAGAAGATERFSWNLLLQAGDPAAQRAEHQGNVKGDAFACPASLALDPRGRLWVGTCVASAAIGKNEMAKLGNNQLLACNTATGDVRRFMTAPVNAEFAGAAFTPDGRTMFVNVQHPGESPLGASDPAAPRRYSNWPDFKPDGRPRSATLAVRRSDGGVVGG
jgi:secreted PhoX family phosphatase